MPSAWAHDQGQRHGTSYGDFGAYMASAARCGAIDHQLQFLLGAWERSKGCAPPPSELRPSPEAGLTWALSTLGRFDHVGVLERLEATQGWIAEQLQLCAPNGTEGRANVGRYDESRGVTDATRAMACARSEHDERLYRWAAALSEEVEVGSAAE